MAAVGDLNHDGKCDLVITDAENNLVDVLLSNGSSIFGEAASYAVGTSPKAVAFGDFNGDGTVDLAAVSSAQAAGSISVLLGNGNGTFQAATGYSVGGTDIAVLDGNADGKADIVVDGFSGVFLLLNNGIGTFGVAQQLLGQAGGNPTTLSVGDFNNDGAPDLVVAIQSAHNATILLNAGPPIPGITLSILPAAAARFVVSAPASAIASGAFNTTVTAFDQFNNTATAYTAVPSISPAATGKLCCRRMPR